MNNDIAPLWSGTSEPLLKALHILTREGKLNADSRRKLKQVQHLTRLITPYLDRTLASLGHLHLVDVGAGKSYLGFLLYDLYLRGHPESRLTSIESRTELIEKSRALARESGFDRMEFIPSTIENATLENTTPEGAGLTLPVDFVCALHACDTATDEAILLGLRHGVRGFALVPCCQAELSAQLEKIPSSEQSPLARHPLHRREFGSHLTNVIRCLYLGSQGYQVTVTELVGWEHSMKNELILAEKKSDSSHPESKKAAHALEALLKEFQVRPKLIK
jgi:hypothetical protein